jgi:HK97 family phage major capsid protein
VPTLIKIVEQRARLWESMKSTLDLAESEKRELSAEENASFEERSSELDRLDGRIRTLREGEQRAADAEAALAEVRSREVSAPLTGGQSSELRDFLAGRTRIFEVRADKPLGMQEFRALSKLTASAGANSVPTSFYNRLIAHMIEVSGVLMAGPTVLNTTSGEQIQVPKTTSHSTGALVAEAGTIGASDPAFGQVPLDAYKYAVLIQVSNELLTDTGVDLEGYLAMQAGRAIGNSLGVHLVTGTGSSQPNGLATAATAGVTGGAGVTGAFTADNLIDLQYSVIAPYRNSPSCGWMLRDATMSAIRKLKDTTNQYIWQPSLQAGAPDVLLGKPVYTDPNVAAVALSAKSVLFGDFSQYFVRMVNGVRFERSDDYAFNTDLVTFRCILRGDGDLVDTTGAVKAFVGNAA